MLKPWRFAVLEHRRERLGITQEEFARAAGKKVQWYQQIQKWISEPKWIDILALAARAGLNLDSLRNQLSKAAPVSQEEVQRDADRIGPRKTRGGKAAVRRITEEERHFRPDRKK